MRDRQEIEREMFAARQDLEEKLDHLVHRVREKTQVRARTTHAARETLRSHVRLLVTVGALAGATVATLLVVRHLRHLRRC